MQKFPQIDENFLYDSRSYRSTDFMTKDIPVTKSKRKPDISITINRSRSCSSGRNRTKSSTTLTQNGIFHDLLSNFISKKYFHTYRFM